MAKKNFAEVRRQSLTHTFKDEPYKTVKMELELKAEDTMKGSVEVYRVEKKKFLFIPYTKKTYVAAYGIKTLVEEIRSGYFNREFSYENNVSYWADIIELAWEKALKRVQDELMRQYNYDMRIRAAKDRSLA